MFAPDRDNHPEHKILATCWEHYEAVFHLNNVTAAKAVISNFWQFYRVLKEHKATADEFMLRAARKQTRQIQYEVRWVAISRYYHDALGVKMTKEEARVQNLTLTREQYMLVPPDWCYGKNDVWAGLVDQWIGEDLEFAAKSNINRANRGSDGTHGQGNRNHWHHKKLQEEKLKRPLSDIELWRLARVRTDRKAGESEYYGHTGENLMSYTEEFQKWNPGTSDPMSMDTDERAVVGIGPKSHGRRIRATNLRPSLRPSPSTSTAQSILAQRHSAYMEFIRQQQSDWNARVAAVVKHNSRMMALMFASIANGQIPTMEPPPPPPGPQPVLPTFEQFLAEHNGTLARNQWIIRRWWCY